MKIYSYSKVNGEYTGEHDAQPSPLEPGKYLISANATVEQPPIAGQHEVAIFETSGWVLKEDHRGRARWKTATAEPIQITEIGPLPAETTDLSPEAVPFPVWTGSAWETDTTAQQAALKVRLKRELEQNAAADAALFRMILAIWDVGVTKGLWANADLPAPIRTMAAEWKQKLQEIDA